MKRIYLYIVLFFASNLIIAQNIQVKYKNIASPIAYLNEELYVNQDKVLSVRDSIVFKNQLNNDISYNEGSNTITIPSREILFKVKYFKNLKNDPIVFSEYLDGKLYCISDSIPRINWVIDHKKSKKILGYLCYEASANFRGSDIIAYFSNELPYSTGPYKFQGLPGLILQVYEKDNTFNSWEAISVTKDTANLGKNSICDNTISLKEFLILQDKKIDERFRQRTSNLSSDVKITRMKVPRQGIEKKYEWE